jgi:hypothetical protein
VGYLLAHNKKLILGLSSLPTSEVSDPKRPALPAADCVNKLVIFGKIGGFATTRMIVPGFGISIGVQSDMGFS